MADCHFDSRLNPLLFTTLPSTVTGTYTHGQPSASVTRLVWGHRVEIFAAMLPKPRAVHPGIACPEAVSSNSWISFMRPSIDRWRRARPRV